MSGLMNGGAFYWNTNVVSTEGSKRGIEALERRVASMIERSNRQRAVTDGALGSTIGGTTSEMKRGAMLHSPPAVVSPINDGFPSFDHAPVEPAPQQHQLGIARSNHLLTPNKLGKQSRRSWEHYYQSYGGGGAAAGRMLVDDQDHEEMEQLPELDHAGPRGTISSGGGILLTTGGGGSSSSFGRFGLSGPPRPDPGDAAGPIMMSLEDDHLLQKRNALSDLAAKAAIKPSALATRAYPGSYAPEQMEGAVPPRPPGGLEQTTGRDLPGTTSSVHSTAHGLPINVEWSPRASKLLARSKSVPGVRPPSGSRPPNLWQGVDIEL